MPDTLSGGAARSAASSHERIEQQVRDFARTLADTHHVLASVFLPGGHQIIATWFGYQEPDMLVVDGTDERGRNVRLLVGNANVHIVLTAIKRLPDRPSSEIVFQSRSDPRG
jgi:hypothetical protein